MDNHLEDYRQILERNIREARRQLSYATLKSETNLIQSDLTRWHKQYKTRFNKRYVRTDFEK